MSALGGRDVFGGKLCALKVTGCAPADECLRVDVVHRGEDQLRVRLSDERVHGKLERSRRIRFGAAGCFTYGWITEITRVDDGRYPRNLVSL